MGTATEHCRPPVAEDLAKDLTTDYKTDAPGILIPAGAEQAITCDGKTTITSEKMRPDLSDAQIEALLHQRR